MLMGELSAAVAMTRRRLSSAAPAGRVLVMMRDCRGWRGSIAATDAEAQTGAISMLLDGADDAASGPVELIDDGKPALAARIRD